MMGLFLVRVTGFPIFQNSSAPSDHVCPTGYCCSPVFSVGIGQRSVRRQRSLNVTASTNRATHTRKVLCTDVEAAVAAGADLVAVHVNVTSRHEGEMFRTLSTVVRKAETFGVPVFAIMYPRREGDGDDDNYQELKKTEPDRYSQLVAHAARIGMELGADVIKTQYTGSPETFERVVEATSPVPIVIAGGPLCSEPDALSAASGAIAAGASGASFGRNVFERNDPARMLRLLHSTVHEDVPAHL